MGDFDVVLCQKTLKELITSSKLGLIKEKKPQLQSLEEDIKFLMGFLKAMEMKRNHYPEMMELVMQIKDLVSEAENIMELFIADTFRADHHNHLPIKNKENNRQHHKPLSLDIESVKKGIKTLTIEVKKIYDEIMCDIKGVTMCDRLCKWGMAVDEICPLCCCEKESHQHLFFGCSYAQVVWNTVWCKTFSIGVPNTLADLLEWFVHNVKGEGFKCRILKCSLAAAVYFIWRERNLRVFQQKSMASDQVAQSAVNSIRDFLSSMRRVKPSMENRVLCTKWGLAEHYILNRQSE